MIKRAAVSNTIPKTPRAQAIDGAFGLISAMSVYMAFVMGKYLSFCARIRLSLTSSIAKEKVIIAPASTLAIMSGNVILRMVCHGVAPRLKEASSRVILVC